MSRAMSMASFCVSVRTVAREFPAPLTCQPPSGWGVTCWFFPSLALLTHAADSEDCHGSFHSPQSEHTFRRKHSVPEWRTDRERWQLESSAGSDSSNHTLRFSSQSDKRIALNVNRIDFLKVVGCSASGFHLNLRCVHTVLLWLHTQSSQVIFRIYAADNRKKAGFYGSLFVTFPYWTKPLYMI